MDIIVHLLFIIFIVLGTIGTVISFLAWKEDYLFIGIGIVFIAIAVNAFLWYGAYLGQW